MKIIFLMINILLLTACASQSAYRAASGNSYGYQETMLSNTQYRIDFKLRGNDSGKAKDLALLRAAELTLLNGYDWFQIVDQETLVEKDDNAASHMGMRRETQTTTTCGLLACKTSTQPGNSMSLAAEFGDKSGAVERSIEIKMGKGIRPDVANTYSASELNNRLATRYQVAQ